MRFSTNRVRVHSALSRTISHGRSRDLIRRILGKMIDRSLPSHSLHLNVYAGSINTETLLLFYGGLLAIHFTMTLFL